MHGHQIGRKLGSKSRGRHAGRRINSDFDALIASLAKMYMIQWERRVLSWALMNDWNQTFDTHRELELTYNSILSSRPIWDILSRCRTALSFTRLAHRTVMDVRKQDYEQASSLERNCLERYCRFDILIYILEYRGIRLITEYCCSHTRRRALMRHKKELHVASRARSACHRDPKKMWQVLKCNNFDWL